MDPGHALTAEVGTAGFMAPQVYDKEYDMKCDMWSMGVTLYLLIAGYLPFVGKTKEDRTKQIRSGKYTLKASIWSETSGDLLRALQGMLRTNPDKRLSAADALLHPWFGRMLPKKEPLWPSPGVVKQLRDFRGLNRFKKAVLHLIVSMLSED